jgi:hypothetical protein
VEVPTTASELADLFIEVGKHHHGAYIESDGVDPEWPVFYAAYLQTKLWDRLGVLLTRSELIHVMVGADLAIKSGEAGGDWATFYAERVRSFAAQKATRQQST